MSHSLRMYICDTAEVGFVESCYFTAFWGEQKNESRTMISDLIWGLPLAFSVFKGLR